MKMKNFRLKLRALATYLLLGIFVLTTLTAGATPAFAQETTPRRAVITSLEGSVLVQAAGQPTALPARRNMEIKSGDRIITGRDGTAEVRYDDGSISRIGPGSRVDITNLSRQTADGAETTVLSAQRGSIWNNAREVVQRNSRFEVNTPAAVAGVRGTNFLVRVQTAADTLVRVYQGLVGIAPAPEEAPEEPVDDDIGVPPSPPPPPPPPEQETSVNPFQQATLTTAAPPPAPAPLDVLDVDDFEKDNLVEDQPAAYVTVETEVKTILVEKTGERLQNELKALAGLTKELELLASKIAAETDPARIAQLQSLQQQLQGELGSRQEVARNVELERQTLTQEKERLTEFKDRIETLTPEDIKTEARSVRQEERERAAERAEREQQTAQQEQAAAAARQQAAQQAEEAGITEELEHAAAQVTEEDIQRQAETLPSPSEPETEQPAPIEEDYSPPQVSMDVINDLTLYRGQIKEVVITTNATSITALSSSPTVAAVSVSASRLTVEGKTPGPATITVTGTRSGYTSISRSFQVEVSDTTPTGFAAGDGSSATPFLISTPEHLDNVRNYLGGDHTGKHFKLANSIDLDVAPWNNDKGWDPIGSPVNPFTGTFDGNGKIVSGLNIVRPYDDYVGLFGYLQDGNVKSLIVSGSVEGNERVGGIVGRNVSGIIENCINNAHVTGSVFVGGIVGGNTTDNEQGKAAQIFECENHGNITGKLWVGGIVGGNDKSCVVNACNNYGIIQGIPLDSSYNYNGEYYYGPTYMGGITGGNSGTVKNSNNSSYVGSEEIGFAVGGIVGGNDADSFVINSHNKTVAVVKGLGFIGGIVGSNIGNIADTTNKGEVSGSLITAGICGYNGSGISDINGINGINGINSLYSDNGNVEGNGNVENSSNYGSVSGAALTGGTVGLNQYGCIADSYNMGNITGKEVTGGLVGGSYGGNITDCYSIGNIEGDYATGGLVGASDGSTIESCFSSGVVAGDNSTGGLLGTNYGSVINCYSTGSVEGGDYYTGGLVGYNNSGTINDCHSIANVSGDNEVGGLVGYNSGSGTIIRSYFYQNPDNSIGINVTPLKMMQLSTFQDWDFTNVWSIVEEMTAPYLQNLTPDDQKPIPAEDSETGEFSGGNGTEDFPYLIATAEELANARLYLDSHFKLISSINLDGFDADEDERGWKPIGAYNSPFTGSFNGDGNTISNLSINRPDEVHIGLFGCTGGSAKIKDITLNYVDIEGSQNVGALVGNNLGNIIGSFSTGTITGESLLGGLVGVNYGTISHSDVAGYVSGTSIIGGLVGLNLQKGGIYNSHATANVTGENKVGGLVGENSPGGNISACFATGNVSGSGSYLGGLVGINGQYMSHEISRIANSYALGSVSGMSFIGGLVGINYDTIEKSYSAGYISGESNIGGLIGINQLGSVTQSYWDTETSGQTESATGTGKNSTEMKQQSTFTGWDFPDIWRLNPTINDGYPFLAWQGGDHLDQETPLLAPDDLTDYRANVGETFIFTVTGATPETQDTVWGTYLYTDDSHLATAAVHAGVLNAGETGIVTVKIMPADYSYQSSTRNAVTTYSWGSWYGSFIFVDAEMFAGGSGTTVDPYKIANAYHLNNVRYHLDKHFILIDDITDMGTFGVNSDWYEDSGAGWEPIGYYISSTNIVPFTGTLDGNFKTISNLYINRPSNNYIGLFGYTNSSALIKNVSLDSVEITAQNFVGSLIGRNNGMVENNTSSGNIEGQKDVGGLTGSNHGTISNSNTAGSVLSTGTTFSFVNIGGLVGWNYGTIDNSYSESTVTGGGQRIGGLVGGNSGSINNSHSSGNVSVAISMAGGLVGENAGGTVNSCYATGDVVGGSFIGGLVGYNDSGGNTINNSFATGDVEGSSNAGGLVGTNRRGTITASLASGNVRASSTTTSNAGGLVGRNGDSGGTAYEGHIVNSYALGSVQGNENVGGLVGNNDNASSTITNSYSAGSVTGTTSTGGLVGRRYLSISGIITNSYWDTQASGQTTGVGTQNNEGVAGKTTAEMTQRVTFEGDQIAPEWDFEATWAIEEDNSYPYLQWQGSTNIPYPVVHDYVFVEGTIPENEATDVNVNTDIRIFFDRMIKQGPSGFNSIELLDDATAVNFTATIVGDGFDLVITPDENLAYDTTYTVIIPANAVEDNAVTGIGMEEAFTFSFTTEVATPNGYFAL